MSTSVYVYDGICLNFIGFNAYTCHVLIIILGWYFLYGIYSYAGIVIFDSVVSAESVNSFKSRLDKFWSMYDFVYDYRASPLAAGSQVSV